MADGARARPGAKASKGSSSERGRSIDPGKLPTKEQPADRSGGGRVPIGCPVSPEEYKRLKDKAKRGESPSRGKAQEDPAIRRRDG